MEVRVGSAKGVREKDGAEREKGTGLGDGGCDLGSFCLEDIVES